MHTRLPGAADRILANGGELLQEPVAEGDLTIAIFADPAGNVFGVWQFGTPAAGPR